MPWYDLPRENHPDLWWAAVKEVCDLTGEVDDMVDHPFAAIALSTRYDEYSGLGDQSIDRARQAADADRRAAVPMDPSSVTSFVRAADYMSALANTAAAMGSMEAQFRHLGQQMGGVGLTANQIQTVSETQEALYLAKAMNGASR